MAKAKGIKFAYDRQDQQISQFKKDIRQLENRTWLTATEQAILAGSVSKNRSTKEEPFISFYNPNNPLNGSSSWSKSQWDYYKQTGKNPITKK
jgi:hypothetical protein